LSFSQFRQGDDAMKQKSANDTEIGFGNTGAPFSGPQNRDAVVA